MEHLYTIFVEGQPVHKDICESDFFEIMADLSTAYYEVGFPDPSTVSHTMYTKEN